MNQLLFGLMRSDYNTLDWKLITSPLTFLIEVVKSLLSALAFVQDPKGDYSQKHAVVTAIFQLYILL